MRRIPLKLTATTIRSLTLPPELREDFFDDALPAFGVRLCGRGSKRYVVQYKHRNKHRRLVLGSVKTARSRQGTRDGEGCVGSGKAWQKSGG